MAGKPAKKVTPMMRQFNEIKAKHPEAMLLFRVGDFYETFGEDAEKAAQTLDIILTKRSNGSASEVALAGFPFHALNTYLPKLVKAGHRVAIVEQLEDPKTVKGLVKRGVTDMITPGINLNNDLLARKEFNFLAALYPAPKGNWGLSLIDISTGSFLFAEGNGEEITAALHSFAPKEVIHPREMDRALRLSLSEEFYLYGVDQWVWEQPYAVERLTTHFGTNSLKGFGLEDSNHATIACGAVLHHLQHSEMGRLDHITQLSRIPLKDFMWLDPFTVQNLELFHPNSPGGKTTLEAIDTTLTPMGGRTLRQWLALPLLNEKDIAQRHQTVEEFLAQAETAAKMRELMSGLPDMERLVSRVATARISPKELNRLLHSLEGCAQAISLAQDQGLTAPVSLPDPQFDLIQKMKDALVDDPAAALGKGDSIRSEHHPELARLRSLLHDATDTLESIRNREAELTGIPSLKLAFNNVFGYYLEVRNSHKDKVPESWHRKQTLVNAERYITEELKTFEAEVLGAEEKIRALESKLFEDLVGEVSQHLRSILHTARWVASLDVLQSFAQAALDHQYVRPTFQEEHHIELHHARHPVIEQVLPPSTPYISNSIELNARESSVAMITGPNMSGKSALLRQVALVQILAQAGSFVPAARATLPIVDRLFVRVGASDNLSKGESTFMVEMNETATILNNISPRSLVILDEIGRGTSTFDGVSIAWGIAEFLHQHPASPLVLFATHYHELNEMEHTFSKVRNYHISVEQRNGTIYFTRQLLPGGTEHSFGLHVAKLAGIPGYVLNRAENLLKSLESHREKKEGRVTDSTPSNQLNFFTLDRPELEEIANELESINLDELKPIEALMLLQTFKEKISKK